MKLLSGKVSPIAKDVVQALLDAELIEVADDMVEEVVMDIESVLKEYIRLDKEISDRARDIIATQHLNYHETNRVKAQVARDREIGIGDQMLEYLIRQITDMLFHSRHVDEVYGMDNELVVVMSPILRRHLNADEDLDLEVKKRIRNMQEGTVAFEVQYKKVQEELRRTRKLG